MKNFESLGLASTWSHNLNLKTAQARTPLLVTYPIVQLSQHTGVALVVHEPLVKRLRVVRWLAFAWFVDMASREARKTHSHNLNCIAPW